MIRQSNANALPAKKERQTRPNEPPIDEEMAEIEALPQVPRHRVTGFELSSGSIEEAAVAYRESFTASRGKLSVHSSIHSPTFSASCSASNGRPSAGVINTSAQGSPERKMILWTRVYCTRYTCSLLWIRRPVASARM